MPAPPGVVSSGYQRKMQSRSAKFRIGQVVKHRFYPFRGVVFDVDPVFSNTEEWWLAIPENRRPSKAVSYTHMTLPTKA